jgi:DNA-binding LytR/AlgR family response regulator
MGAATALIAADETVLREALLGILAGLSPQRVISADAGDRFPAACALAAQLNPAAATGYLQWIQASVGTSIQMIPVADVLFFISDEKYTRVQTAQLEALIRKPIKELVDELDPQLFWQIHRSTLVNVNSVAGVARDFRGRQIVSVKGRPDKLEVSRSYAGLFKGM